MRARRIAKFIIANTIGMIRAAIYGILGWCLEVLWTGLGSLFSGDPKLTATTYLWMFPIYGLAILLEPLHDRIRHLSWIFRGLLWMMVFFGVEYVTGWLIRETVGVSPWNYDNARWNIQGLVRLDYAPVWFCLGLIFEKVHDMTKLIKL